MSELAIQEYRRVSSQARRVFVRFVSALNRRDDFDIAVNQPRHPLTPERREWLTEQLIKKIHEVEHCAQEIGSFDGRLRRLERDLEMT